MSIANIKRYMDLVPLDARHDPHAISRIKSDASIGNRTTDIELGTRFNKSNRVTAVDRESLFSMKGLVATKTDLRGTITYCNNAFSKICGWSKEELLISNHNLVRHPDMPKIVFELMWDTIKNKREFYGYVKNLHKDGSYYWILAYVTPDFDEQGEIEGYTSYRKFAPELAIGTVIPIYQQLLAAEKQGANSEETTLLFNKHLKVKGFSNYDQFILDLQFRANASMMN